MAIIGLTDDIVPRFPRLGKLRKGGEKTSQGYGPDLDHWRFTSEQPEIVEAFHAAYGREPRLVRIYIPFETVEQAFPTWCEVWGASGLMHRCDGQTMTIWRAGDRFERGAKPCNGGHEKGDPRNDAVGRLEFVLPELVDAGYVGYVTMETHSINDILNISRALKAVYQSRQDLRGVEFTLRRVKETIGAPGFGKRAGDRSRVDKWLVRLEPAADWVRLQLAQERAEALSLPAPASTEVIDGETGELVVLPAPTSAPVEQPEQLVKANGNTVPAEQPPAPSSDRRDRPGIGQKTATIKVSMAEWNAFCGSFAAEFPSYRNREGQADKFHIGCAVVACDFGVVTSENVEQVKKALRDRAQAKGEPVGEAVEEEMPF